MIFLVFEGQLYSLMQLSGLTFAQLYCAGLFGDSCFL